MEINWQKIEDKKYMQMLSSYVSKNNLHSHIKFESAVTWENLPRIYNGYAMCLNLTDSGSFDKTIVEAAACGAVPIVSNVSLTGLLPEICITKTSPSAIAESIQRLFDSNQQVEIQQKLKDFAESQSLEKLINRLIDELK